MLQYNANPNIQDNFDIGFNTPLHLAAEDNLVNIMELFLEKGGDPTIKNKWGFTWLHIAARSGFANMVKLLIAKGVDPNIRDKFGNNASYWAKEYDHYEVIEILPEPLKISKEEFTGIIFLIFKLIVCIAGVKTKI